MESAKKLVETMAIEGDISGMDDFPLPGVILV
jgi:hypothetical protein